MRHILLAMLVLSLAGASVSFSAETTPNRGPEIIRFHMGDLTLPFRHWGHQRLVNNQCSPCHGSTPGKIDNWGKEIAHALCIPCHETRRRGPVECKECHQTTVSIKQLPPAKGKD